MTLFNLKTKPSMSKETTTNSKRHFTPNIVYSKDFIMKEVLTAIAESDHQIAIWLQKNFPTGYTQDTPLTIKVWLMDRCKDSFCQSWVNGYQDIISVHGNGSKNMIFAYDRWKLRFIQDTKIKDEFLTFFKVTSNIW